MRPNSGAWVRARRLVLLATLGGTALAGAAQSAPRLDYRGAALTRRQVETELSGALRAPGDTVVLARALSALCARLQEAGYLDARVVATWEPPAVPAAAGSAGAREGSDPTLRLDLREGTRHRIARLDFDVPPADSSGLSAAFSLRAGDWASVTALAEAARRALRVLAENGYPYAQIGVSDFDWDSAGARVRIQGAPGPKVTVTGVHVAGLRATRASLAERSLQRAIGRPYSPAAAEAGRERLLQLGLFRSVTWAGLEGEPDWGRARIAYRVDELRYNQFEAALGARAEGGASGLARLELGNLAGTGRALGARWESRGRGVEVLAARYVEPLLLGAPLRAEAMLEHQREDTLFTRARWGGRLQFLISGHERIEAGYEQEQVLQPHAAVSEAALQSTVFALERDTRDSPTLARRGARIRVAATQTFKRETLPPAGRAQARSSTVEGIADWSRPLSERLGLSWQLRGAARFSSQPTLALFERFPLGGTTTLRGYDEQAFRVDRFLLSRMENRWFLGPTGQHLALFWDHGWTFTRIEGPAGPQPQSRHRDGFGFGLRFEGAAGLLGVDYGLEPGRSPAEGKLHIQLVSSF